MINKMKKDFSLILQARKNSSRLPGKIYLKILDKTIIEILMMRLSKVRNVENFILAVPKKDRNKTLTKIASKYNFKVFYGSEKDVLLRYYNAAKKFNVKNIVRITADCPLADPNLIDKYIKSFYEKKIDILSNCFLPTLPDGLDVEIFKFSVLEFANKNIKNILHREHVINHLYKKKKFKIYHSKQKKNYSKMRLTLDYKEDFKVFEYIFKKFKYDFLVDYKKVINFLDANPNIKKLNQKFKRNEGMFYGTGQKKWVYANSLIPGGSMLYSKKAENFLYKFWPSYFSKSKKIFLWDLDGNKYMDFIFAVGTNLLGYSNSKINNSVIDSIKKGNMTTLNCPEEVDLASKLVEMHPWSSMVKFSRSGGEANAIAIRIARAYVKKNNVAICGYHGWHDWYMASNFENRNNLNNHLMPNISIKGVSTSLRNSCYSFEYNDYEKVKSLIEKNKVGTIIMEVFRSVEPKNNFLKKIRKLCDETGTVLIFDECTSGFRENFGGLHLKYKIYPDMAMFGKALGNGHAITAVIGKREIMEAANNTFISSTFWTERSGYSAAIKTLELMKKNKTWLKISKMGKYIDKEWKKLAKKNNIKIQTSGLPGLKNFNFISKDNIKYKFLITQEMLKKKILASNCIYLSTEHTLAYVKIYLKELEGVFKIIGKCENKILNIDSHITIPENLSLFKRYN